MPIMKKIIIINSLMQGSSLSLLLLLLLAITILPHVALAKSKSTKTKSGAERHYDKLGKSASPKKKGFDNGSLKGRFSYFNKEGNVESFRGSL